MKNIHRLLYIALVLILVTVFTVTRRPLSSDEKRELSTAIAGIESDPERAHDEYIRVSRFGSKDAVPILIQAISKLERPNERGNVICTSAHCIEALERMTRKNFGYDQSAWERWWRGEGSKLPKGYFEPSIPMVWERLTGRVWQR